MRQLNEQETRELNNRFSYHPPKGDQRERYEIIRAKTLELATVMSQCCLPSRELSTALTQLTLANMLANSAIAINE